MKFLVYNPAFIFVAMLTLGLSARASTVSVAFVGADTGVSDGVDFVAPYQLNINGIVTDATCYDIFDQVSGGQTWTANELTLGEAVATGQFKGDSNALAGYEQVGFLSQQTTNSAQNQIDLQHDIWNVFAPGTYTVTAGMQAYLNLLTGPGFTSFDFSTVEFLEDVDQTSRAQAFVIDPPSTAPEPGTIALAGAGALMVCLSRIGKRRLASGDSL